ncbi:MULTISPECIES: hypothetical protein [unclassified Streptomyces]|uniref:hypothetical protein n=1 Tax=unclassified Streptomyces TaxID=2593676 RepID=UPI0029669FEE|nr:hypothetical protein [Streptomyces sp. SJL17-1]
MNGTFTVRIDGIRACAIHPERWPDPYREGAVLELFINADGQADAYAPASADCAAELLQHHSVPERVLTELASVLAAASWSLTFQQNHAEIIDAMKTATAKMPSQAAECWSNIIMDLEARAPYGDR